MLAAEEPGSCWEGRRKDAAGGRKAFVRVGNEPSRSGPSSSSLTASRRQFLEAGRMRIKLSTPTLTQAPSAAPVWHVHQHKTPNSSQCHLHVSEFSVQTPYTGISPLETWQLPAPFITRGDGIMRRPCQSPFLKTTTRPQRPPTPPAQCPEFKPSRSPRIWLNPPSPPKESPLSPLAPVQVSVRCWEGGNAAGYVRETASKS